MRLVFPAFMLALSVLPAMAQDAGEGFQQRAMEAAATPGGTRVPNLCGGLFQALALLSANDPDTSADYRERVDAALNIGTVVHMLDMADEGIEAEKAQDFILGRISAVAGIYGEWFQYNLATTQDPISDRFLANFTFCDDHYLEWTATPSDE